MWKPIGKAFTANSTDSKEYAAGTVFRSQKHTVTGKYRTKIRYPNGSKEVKYW